MKILLVILSAAWVLLAEPFLPDGARPTPLGTGALIAAQPFEEVLQTSHNFLPRRAVGDRRRVCMACHTDGAVLIQAGEADLPRESGSVPLWTPRQKPRQFSLPGALARMNGRTDRKPFGSSYACLGCHDGALAVDMHGERKGTDEAAPAPGRSMDHPSAIPYPRRPSGAFINDRPTPGSQRYWSIADLTADGLVMPTGPVSSYFRPAATDDPSASSSVIRTSYGIMHCDSCHNPHNNQNPPYLRTSHQDLCFVCHDR